MVKSNLSLTCILATWAAMTMLVSGEIQSAPSSQPPTMDCTTVIYNMVDCISFLSSGEDETIPDSACCSGLKSVLKIDADCICYALSNAASLGLDINMTRAEALHSECGLSTGQLTNCNVSTSPSASPGPANPPSPTTAPPSISPSLPPTTPPPSAATPSPAESPEAPSPSQSPEAPSPAASTEAPSPAAGGVPPSEAGETTPASGAYTISAAFSAFLIAIASNFLTV